MENIRQLLNQHQDRFIGELLDLLKIPSISADPAYRDDVLAAARYIKEKLESAGAENVQLIDTGGYPVVYGERIVNPALPTVLVYGHYDVQPPDPLELWTNPPFEPVIRDGNIYARGASDDKSQMFMHIKAFELMNATGSLPCNVKFMIEGEEEVGSENLDTFLGNYRSLLNADVVLVSDTALLAPDIPSITVGLRGLSYVEVEVIGPNRDLHSGIYGGAVANPANTLCKMIAALKDGQNRITIPGFYDDIADIPPEEREAIAKIPFDEEAFKKSLDIEAVEGEAGYSTYERVAIRPTLDVNGIWSGYTGKGAKTVLPARAHAKISMRLVPDQKSRKITELFTDYFKKLAPPSVKVNVTPMHGGEPVVVPVNGAGYRAAEAAMEKTFGKKPLPIRTGGSIPVVASFKDILGLDTILMGFGLDSDAIHSPDEHFAIQRYFLGIETIPWFYHYFNLFHKENP